MATRNGNGDRKSRKRGQVEAYVPCQVEPGMFEGEYLVTFTAADARNPEQPVRVRLLADQNEVVVQSGKPEREKPVPGLLRVEVVQRAKGFALIVLPQPAQPVGERAYVSEDVIQGKIGV